MKKNRCFIIGMMLMALIVTSVPAFAAVGGENVDNEQLLSIEEQEKAFDELDKQPVRADGDDPNAITPYKWVYPTRKGIILVTKDTVHKVAKIVGHAAIVYSKDKIIEATSDGVKLGKNNWHEKSSCWAGNVIDTGDPQDAAVADWCYKQKGKPYNWEFTNTTTRQKFYCSHLVYAGFKDKYGVNLNYGGGIVYPADLLKDENKTSIVYKKGTI